MEGWVSVGVLATTFDSVCETKLEATVGERANSFPITVTAISEAGVGCPVEMRHVLVKRTKLPGKVVVVDGATGRNVKLGGAFPGGEQPGYPSWPFEQAELLPDGQTIRLAFSGTPWESGPCGVEYVVTARESADQVEIRLDSRMSESKSSSNPCPDVAGRRTVEVKLSQPLAGRPVFDYTGRLLNIAR